MALRLEWEQEPETPQLFEQATADRYATANQLFAAGEWDACIYLFGYVAELVLKAAYFRFLNSNNFVALITSMLGPAKRRSEELQVLGMMPNAGHESYHSLRFWSELLRAERQEQMRQAQQAGQAPPPAPNYNDTDLVQYTQTLYENWMVEMRYHPNRATEADATKVAEAAKWLFDKRVDLGA